MTEHIDKEIEAIKAVLLALEPLSVEIRTNVLKYVLGRLQIVLPSVHQMDVLNKLPPAADPVHGVVDVRAERQTTPTHIKSFKEEKKPRSAIEMAAIVAYFLANLAPQKDHKDTITAKELETYFKIAEYPLGNLQFTLPNAKNAGYLDAVGNGEYKLNAVGHNLVVHSMPRGAGETAKKRQPAKNSRRPAKKR